MSQNCSVCFNKVSQLMKFCPDCANPIGSNGEPEVQVLENISNICTLESPVKCDDPRANTNTKCCLEDKHPYQSWYEFQMHTEKTGCNCPGYSNYTKWRPLWILLFDKISRIAGRPPTFIAIVRDSTDTIQLHNQTKALPELAKLGKLTCDIFHVHAAYIVWDRNGNYVNCNTNLLFTSKEIEDCFEPLRGCKWYKRGEYGLSLWGLDAPKLENLYPLHPYLRMYSTVLKTDTLKARLCPSQ